MSAAEAFLESKVQPAVRGFLHRPAQPSGDGLVLSHGAGSNCNAPLLVALAEAFTDKGFTVLRCDLPFRQDKPFGPPMGSAVRDQAGLRNAVLLMRKLVTGCVFLGGHSYGGRQSTMLCAQEPGLVLSYPLHPPRKPDQLRVQHLPKLRTSSLFVHGTRDPFGSIEEMQKAILLIPAKTELLPVEGAGHDLGFQGKTQRKDLPGQIAASSLEFFVCSP
jgi:predicted alpha/beta-hydrolase family hydrolase